MYLFIEILCKSFSSLLFPLLSSLKHCDYSRERVECLEEQRDYLIRVDGNGYPVERRGLER